MRGEIRLDLVGFRHAVSNGQPVLERPILKAQMPMTESGWYGVPEEVILPTSTVRFLGVDIACPNHAEFYLHILYGNFEETKLTFVDDAAAEIRHLIDWPSH